MWSSYMSEWLKAHANISWCSPPEISQNFAAGKKLTLKLRRKNKICLVQRSDWDQKLTSSNCIDYKVCLYQWVFKKLDAKENSMLFHDRYQKKQHPISSICISPSLPISSTPSIFPQKVPSVQSYVVVGWLHSSAWRTSRLLAHLRGGLLKERAAY